MDLIKKFTRNTAGRDLLVGDIHGCFTKLQQALAAVGFNPEAGDRLFSVGDLVDRGPESLSAQEWLAKPWFHAVRGNHEQFAVEFASGNCAADLYAYNGGAWNIGRFAWEQRLTADAFAALPLAIELETASGLVGIVHADCPFAQWSDLVAALEAGSDRALQQSLQWGRDRANGLLDGPVQGVRAVVCGHTPMQRVTSLDNVLFIDVGAWIPSRGADFAILDAETLQPAKKAVLA